MIYYTKNYQLDIILELKAEVPCPVQCSVYKTIFRVLSSLGSQWTTTWSDSTVNDKSKPLLDVQESWIKQFDYNMLCLEHFQESAFDDF